MILIVELWLSKINFIRQAENIILRVLYVWLIGTWILRRSQKILGATYLRMERCVQKSSGPPRVKLTGINISLYVVLPLVFFVTTFVFLWESLRSNLLALDHNDSHKNMYRNSTVATLFSSFRLCTFLSYVGVYNLSWLDHIILGVECGNIVVIVY